MTGMGAGERAGLVLECGSGAVESHNDEFVKFKLVSVIPHVSYGERKRRTTKMTREKQRIR